MDLFEELLEVLDSHIVETNDVTSPSSLKTALANAQPVTIPPDSSISLLSECFANVWAEPESDSNSGNISTVLLPQPSVAFDAPSETADPSSPVPKSERGETGSRLSIAVKNRMQRDKAGSSSIITTDSADSSTPPAATTQGEGSNDAIVTTCFQSFLAEMKDFQQNSSQLKKKQDIAKYADYLHQKYITLGLDKVNNGECATAAETQKIIETFISKLRARPDGQAESATVAPSIPWACAVCTFQNSPSQCKCQTCGRARGTTPKKKPPPKPVHVPIISAPARAKKSNKSPFDRRKDMFLKQKDDYEQDAREDIADEITDLLSTVRAATDKPK